MQNKLLQVIVYFYMDKWQFNIWNCYEDEILSILCVHAMASVA